jgi:hypothetical protein
MLTPLTDARFNPISMLQLWFDDFLPEYPSPPTYRQGATLVLNTRGWEEVKIENIIKDVRLYITTYFLFHIN